MLKNSFRVLISVAFLFLLGFAISFFSDNHRFSGPLLTLFFACLAISFHLNEKLKRLAFTIWIFAAVTISMTYPAPFQQIGNFQLKKLIVPLIQIIMFGMGSQLSLKNFADVVRMPKGVLVGIVSQFTIMPFVGFGIAKVFGFPPEIAAGIILVGCSPSGLASNVMSYIAKANLALAVTLTAVATLMAPVMTPLLMKMLAGQYVPIDFWAMMLTIIKMVILPIAAGLAFNSIVIRYYLKGKNEGVNQIMSLISMTGIAVIITIITAAGRDSLMSIGLVLIGACLIHNLSGYFLGYWGCKLLRMDEQSCRTIALEVGMQNGGLASGIALEMGKIATVGLASAVFGPMMNITGSSLASWWRGKT